MLKSIKCGVCEETVRLHRKARRESPLSRSIIALVLAKDMHIFGDLKNRERKYKSKKLNRMYSVLYARDNSRSAIIVVEGLRCLYVDSTPVRVDASPRSHVASVKLASCQ
ncbi:hypothetical protein KGM_215289 [Danaus plexippus plexippus]|uniref:Uncharacterized protein n=1 Tax=Danaus plexippus plexippus TaxID=278856 RepID=A0A212ETI2_DANPL|nr:hypothetical protein KGM_215289 [Danaus plexippus plexippus]